MKNFYNFLKSNAKNLGLFAILLAICDPTFAASSSSTTSLPFNDALTTIRDALTGPVAKTIAIVGIVASGAALIWGGEIGGFLKSVIYLVLVVSLIICAESFLDLIGGSGASIAEVSSSAGLILAA